MKRPEALDNVPRPDEWTKTASTDEAVASMKKQEDETKSQAAALIETQRRSVEVLTDVRQRVESLPAEAICKSLISSDSDGIGDSNSHSLCYVFDNLLDDLHLTEEMQAEGRSMFENNKLELDLKAGICSGEYAAAIKGGEEYADCPRTVEFVVSLTRHLTGLLNRVVVVDGKVEVEAKPEAGAEVETKTGADKLLGYSLDEAASMAGIRYFNRDARVSSMALLTNNAVDDDTESTRPFELVVDGNSDEADLRKVTLLYFLMPEGWDNKCGGGVTIRSNNDNGDGEDITIEAKNDRVVILNSETCLHRMEEWRGSEGMPSGSLIVTHFVGK